MDGYKILENNFEQYYQLNNVKILLEWDKYVNLPPESNFTFVDNIHALELAQNSLIKQDSIKNLIEKSENQLIDQVQLRNFALMKRVFEELSLYPPKLEKDLLGFVAQIKNGLNPPLPKILV